MCKGNDAEIEKAVDEHVAMAKYRTTKPLDDPWAHRTESMRCKTCMWFATKTASLGAREIGRCRRHAPTMNGYPVVFAADWCGDHKLDESKA